VFGRYPSDEIASLVIKLLKGDLLSNLKESEDLWGFLARTKTMPDKVKALWRDCDVFNSMFESLSWRHLLAARVILLYNEEPIRGYQEDLLV
jgi:hypothetical protein